MSIIAVFRYFGILQLVNIGKSLPRRNIFVLIESTNRPVTTNNNTYAVTGASTTTSNTKPTYYSKKPWNTQPKPKMSNSFELLTGSIAEIQKKYEILSDIVSEYNGKVHGSQRDRDPKTGLIDLLVYYEVPEGKRDEVKRN